MKHFKPAMISAFTGVVVAISGCTITSQNMNEAISSAQVITKSDTMVRTIEGIEEHQLGNGLKVLLFEDASQPKTLVNITYRVGSVHENYGETGMAHLLEHMLFKGSENYPDINTEFKKRGMATNATTWLDRTNYFEVFDANEETLAWALGMEADRMINATFTKAQLDSEMTVVRNEMERGENSPTRMLLSRMFSLSYLWHNYGNSTIGARSDVENFPFERLRQFYKNHYRPDNAVLMVAGRFDKEQTLELIQQEFGKIRQPSAPLQPLYTQEPTQDGERIVNLRRTGELPFVGLAYHVPSGLHPDAAAVSLLEEILGDYTRGRLQKQLVEPGLATGASSFTFLLKDSSQFIFLVQGEKGVDSTQMEAKLLEIAEQIKANPITAEELNRAKLKLAKQAEQAMRDVTGIGMELSEYIAKGDYRYAFYFRDLIAKTTLEQVQQAAEKYLVKSNRTLGRFIPTTDPQRAEIPKAPDVQELLKDYKGQAVVAQGEVYDNTVANINNRLVQTTWPEGTKLNVYPKKLRGDEVVITMNFPAGNAQQLAGHSSAISMVGSMLKLGNEKYSKEAIATQFDQLKSSVNISTSLGMSNVSITTDKENLNDTINFLGELLANPTFPETELEVLKRSAIADVESQRADPRAIASNSFRKALYDYPKGHPKAYRSLEQRIDDLKSITSEQLSALYQQQFSIKQGHITVVGDVDSQQISDLLRANLKAYNQDTAYQYMPMALKDKSGLVISTETPDKANAQLYVINPIMMDVKHPDYLALRIANDIFGGDAFTSRIGARIRVKEGYSYSVGAGMQVSVKDKQGLFYAVAIAAPENMDAVISAFKEEVDKVKSQGFNQEELDTAITGFISQRTRAWASDKRIASVINNASSDALPLSYYQQQLNDVQQLTLEDVNQAFNKYIGQMDFNIFKAGDFASVEK
ncbi:M16 family metallopeptidase [Thalassotalea aquiviva]|uniref:M16 family metallopeptidase n=1 Tax=Thalassotalea aquiviva TaxID=3242415 RepID=UPI00352A3C59